MVKGISGAVIVLLFVCLSITIARSNSTGAPSGYSGVPAGGGFPAEDTCVSCHQSFPLNPDTAGKLELLGVPEVYELGHRYTLTVKISHPDATRWGFQITAVAVDSLRGAGDFMPMPNDQNTQRITGTLGNRVYVEHGPKGKGATGLGQRDSYSWRFDWVAPSTNVGDVAFFGVGAAANGDGSVAGDKIYSPSPRPLARTKGGETRHRSE